MYRLFPTIFALVYLSSTLSAINNPTPQEGAWEILEGCRLIDAPINDGDSFKIKHEGKTFIIRLYFVDCPETYDTYPDRLSDQARYFSIPESEVLASGRLAQLYTKKFLKGNFTVLTRWSDARGGADQRYFGIVRKADELLSAELVRSGLARIYGMPTKSAWPGGITSWEYLKHLKQYERLAQQNNTGIWGSAAGSHQLAGLEHISNLTEIPIASKAHTGYVANQSKINLNTASAAELETLPGIGPALAAKIITARPMESIDGLAEISGISLKKIDAFREWVITKTPPPPPLTAAYYLADSATFLNTKVDILVATIVESPLAAPEGFKAVNVHTANEGRPGGSITAFIPDEYYESFVIYYEQPNRIFTGLLVQKENTIVLVYRRK